MINFAWLIFWKKQEQQNATHLQPNEWYATFTQCVRPKDPPKGSVDHAENIKQSFDNKVFFETIAEQNKGAYSLDFFSTRAEAVRNCNGSRTASNWAIISVANLPFELQTDPNVPSVRNFPRGQDLTLDMIKRIDIPFREAGKLQYVEINNSYASNIQLNRKDSGANVY